MRPIVPMCMLRYRWKVIHFFSPLPKKYVCPLCDTKLKYFKPLVHPLEPEGYEFIYKDREFETASEENHLCPFCMAIDRDRLFVLHFRKVFEHRPKSLINLLDIAPSLPLQKFLKRYPFLRYRSADLHSPKAMDKVNIESMDIYAEGQFDVFICSHVLEHVERPDKALSELYRILKPGGWGIIMVPIMVGLERTLEDKIHIGEAERIKFYGQFDHLRLFSKQDFINDIEAAGFKIRQLGVDYFGMEAFSLAGIEKNSVLYIAEKPEQIR